MKSVDLAHLRNVVIAAHAGAGKTTLAEHLLHEGGALARLGRVDDGTASLDFEPEEQKRHISLSLAVASFEHAEHRITLIDTPGYADFQAEVVSGFAAADGAVFVMDGSGGVQAGTEFAVATGRQTGTAALFVISRCDRENADPAAALDALRSSFGVKIAPLHLAVGKSDAFAGYVDLVRMRAWTLQGGTMIEGDVPAELADEATRRRDQLLEAAAEADDDVMMKYLEGEEISPDELDTCLASGVRRSILAPVLVTSAAKGIGLSALADAIVRYLPSPAERPPASATNAKTKAAVELPADPSGPLCVRVFKTTADPFVGRLNYLRVLSGTLHSQAPVFNATRGEDERAGQLLHLKGKDQEPVGELRAGDIGAVAKLTVTATGDTLSAKDQPLVLPPLAFPEPTLAVAVEPQTKADLDKLSGALQRMLDEEPSARVERSEAGEQLLRGIGETHIAVIGERLKRKFGTSILTGTPRVPYRETIRGRTQVHGRYKKQTGGHGMFADVWIALEPNPGGGVEFAEKVVGGSVPRQFFPGVEKGIRETASEGVLAGYPLSDFKATLYDGQFHTVDSNELSFKIAASMALKQGVMEANPVLLEPIMVIEVRVPEEYMGDVNRDLNTRRGRVLGMDTLGDGLQVVRAHVPQAELFTYATELRSFTHGRGSFHAEMDHYEEVPAHLAQRIVEAHRKDGAKEG